MFVLYMYCFAGSFTGGKGRTRELFLGARDFLRIKAIFSCLNRMCKTEHMERREDRGVRKEFTGEAGGFQTVRVEVQVHVLLCIIEQSKYSAKFFTCLTQLLITDSYLLKLRA